MFKLLFLTLLPMQRCDRTLTHSHRTLTPKNRLFPPLKNDRQEEGFSILEVLVTILVITGFILGSLQATVLATFMRVQAQDKQEATNWVQQDLELIRYQAFILTGGTCGSYGSALLNDPTDGLLQPTSDPRFPTNESIEINDKWYRVFREYDSSGGNVLGISYALLYSDGNGGATGEEVHPRYKSNDSYNGKTYTEVTDPNNDGNINDRISNVVTTLSTEVLPDAALQPCP